MTKDGVKKMGQGWMILPADADILAPLCQDRVFGLGGEVLSRNCSHFKKTLTAPKVTASTSK